MLFGWFFLVEVDGVGVFFLFFRVRFFRLVVELREKLRVFGIEVEGRGIW